LTSERAHPIVSYKLGMPAQPVAPPFPSLTDPADRLVAALRLVCAGSVVATRAIRRQHDDDFPLIPGTRAVLSAVPAADYTRPTLLTGDQVEAVQQVYGWLEQPTVAADRNLQKALRRLVYSGSHREATERLTDLMVCAEVLFLKRNDYVGRTKSAEIATRVEELLATDTTLGVAGSQLREFMTDAYRVRNAEMHGDDPATLQLRRLDGAPTDSLHAVAEDVERVMRRAVHRVVVEVAGSRLPSLATI
jgi:hypothetical protein